MMSMTRYVFQREDKVTIVYWMLICKTFSSQLNRWNGLDALDGRRASRSAKEMAQEAAELATLFPAAAPKQQSEQPDSCETAPRR